MRDTFLAIFAPNKLALQFALKTLLGSVLALWLAMRLELEQPSWAFLTAVIVAQPLSGMVLQKGMARLCGTIAGTVMSVVIMALAGQAPWLFLLMVASWLALCTALSTMLRSAWAYAYVLAGYTVAIIALPSIGHPLGVFDQAISRCTEISLGIVCATVASAVIWPLRVEQQLMTQARRIWTNGLQAAQDMLTGGEDKPKELLAVLGGIVAVDSQREHAWFEGTSGRLRGRSILAMTQKLLVLLRIARSVRRQWRQLDEEQSRHLVPWLSEIARALGEGDEQELKALRQRLVVHQGELGSPVERYCVVRCILLIDKAMEAAAALKGVEQGRAPANVPEGLAVHRDVQMGILFGSRSALAFLAVSAFWLATNWASAPGGLVLTCVICGLFASKENGAQIGFSFLRGVLLAWVVGVFVGQYILPQWSGFPMLVMAVGVPLFMGLLCMSNPRVGPTATSFALNFIIMVTPANPMHFSFENALNSGQASVMGCLAAVLAFKLLVFHNPVRQARRLHGAIRDDLVRLTQRDLRDADTWFGGRMADGLIQLARLHLTVDQEHSYYRAGGLYGLDMGDELLHLRLSLARAGVPLKGEQEAYLRRLRGLFEQEQSSKNVDDLDQATEEFLTSLKNRPSSFALELAQGALVQLNKSWRKWCMAQEKTHGVA